MSSITIFAMEDKKDFDPTLPAIANPDNPSDIKIEIPESPELCSERHQKIACVACSGCLALTFLGVLGTKIYINYINNH